MRKNFYLKFVFFFFIAVNTCFAYIPPFLAVDTFGCEALINGNYHRALEMLWSEKNISDSAFWNFKKGIGHFNIKDFNNAEACFLYCIKKDSLLASTSYEYLGDIESAKKQIRDAVGSYLSARKDSLINPVHYNSINNKIAALVNTHTRLIDSMPFLNAWRIEMAVSKKRNDTVAAVVLNCDALDTLELCKNAIAADSILACFMDSDSVNILCSTLSRLKALNVSDSLFLTKRLFQLSKTALQCKMYDDALMWLTKAKTRADFGTVITAKASLRHEALLEYYNSNYKLALSLLLQYKSQFGPIPEIIIAIARTYRNLGQDSLSLETYDLFSRLFPQNLLIESVLWNLALENDQRGNYDKAIFFYRKASLLKKNPEKSANALFRIGLCYYKAQKYSKACASFTLCLISFPDAPVAIACLYWKAQSLLANADEKKARNQFAEIIQTSPTDFYAYRAREALTLMGDTARLVAFDTACDRDLGRKWLDSISLLTGDVVTLTDSCLFVKTKKLALAGCSGIVGNYLEYLEKRYPSNLQLQYDLALIYELINNHAASFRVGRRIVWRLPAKDRSSVPQFVYNVSYPLAYFDIVKKAATADTVDPLFVLSIIKQESVFDYGIMSKAGAVGLMQLMPATAKEIAADLSEIYASDSLVKPSANIRYGTHYVKKLLDRFHGNMVQAIAGYNGGPPAIMRWFERNKSKNFDIFIEDIGYEETRNYVKKVLANYWTYTRLYKFDRTSMP